MTTNEKTQLMKANLKLIKKLINKVIDYNMKTGAHIFFGHEPHCNQVDFRIYNTPDKKWHSGSTSDLINRETIYYDYPTKKVQEQIKEVEKWML